MIDFSGEMLHIAFSYVINDFVHHGKGGWFNKITFSGFGWGRFRYTLW